MVPRAQMRLAASKRKEEDNAFSFFRKSISIVLITFALIFIKWSDVFSSSAARDGVEEVLPKWSYNTNCDRRDEAVALHNNIELPNYLRNYVKTHRLSREELARDTSHLFRGNESRILIWRCGVVSEEYPRQACGGLGSRTNGIRFALLVAMLSNRTFFLEFPNSPAPISAALRPSMINWELPESIKRLIPKIPITEDWDDPMPFGASAYWDKTEERLEQNTSQNNLLRGFPNIVTTTTILYHAAFLRFLRKYSIPEVLGIEKHKIGFYLTKMLFTPTEIVESKIAFRNIDDKQYIAAHLRTGVDVRESEIYDRFNGIRRIGVRRTVSNLLDCILQHGGNLSLVYFATDSAAHAKEFQRQGRERKLSVLVSPTSALHLEQPQVIKGREHDVCDRFLNVFGDFYSLSRATSLIATKSGFSLAAAVTGMPHTYVEFDISEDAIEPKCQKRTF